jgi:Xaa-Pro aminopeptidase
MDTRTAPARLRIARLRETLHTQGTHAVLVPSSDPHLSEYLPGHWQGREWFSGFTRPMETPVVTGARPTGPSGPRSRWPSASLPLRA